MHKVTAKTVGLGNKETLPNERETTMATKHIKQHLVCWQYCHNDCTYHMQHYPTKEIADDKIAQLKADFAVRGIRYRCVVFKFDP